MTKTLLINMLEQHRFRRPDADALVSGLTAEMVKAAERETPSAIVGLYGGVIATGLIVIGHVDKLMIVPIRSPVDAIAAGMQSKFTEFSEGIATQIAGADVDAHALSIEVRRVSAGSRRVWVPSKADLPRSKTSLTVSTPGLTPSTTKSACSATRSAHP